MGIINFLKKQFIDVIDWTESGDGVLAYRYPMQDREIQNGAKLTVRDTQVALFVNEGEIADLFGPGMHTLTTRTLPIMTNLKNWDKAFDSPFKSDLYFFSTREQIDQKWGTPQPITIRDKEYGPIRIRAFGAYSYKLKDVKLFHRKISGTRDVYTAAEFEGQLRSMLLMSITTFLGSAPVGFVDMAANQQKFSETLKEPIAKAFAEYGLKLETFMVSSLSLPEELQSKFDAASSMRIVGDTAAYAQFQAADSIKDAAKNSGGMMGMGAILNVGGAMGQTMGNALGGGSGAPAGEDPVVTIEKLHALVQKGVLTQAEFEAKKAELLKKIR